MRLLHLKLSIKPRHPTLLFLSVVTTKKKGAEVECEIFLSSKEKRLEKLFAIVSSCCWSKCFDRWTERVAIWRSSEAMSIVRCCKLHFVCELTRDWMMFTRILSTSCSDLHPGILFSYCEKIFSTIPVWVSSTALNLCVIEISLRILLRELSSNLLFNMTSDCRNTAKDIF